MAVDSDGFASVRLTTIFDPGIDMAILKPEVRDTLIWNQLVYANSNYFYNVLGPEKQ